MALIITERLNQNSKVEGCKIKSVKSKMLKLSIKLKKKTAVTILYK